MNCFPDNSASQHIRDAIRRRELRHYLFVFISVLNLVVLPQLPGVRRTLLAQNDPNSIALTEEVQSDSLLMLPVSDRSRLKARLKLNNGAGSHPIHPYFRDGYRVIQDLRRLVRMFNFRAVTGYESVADLVAVCRKFPERKQTELIYTAMAGGAVTVLAAETNKQLRKRKINFLQWKVEKLLFRNRFKYFRLSMYAGYTSKGVAIYIPSLRLYYYRLLAPYYSGGGISFFATRKVALNYSRWNGYPIFTPYFFLPLGTIALSYDPGRKIIRSRLDLRKTSSLVIRIAYINFLQGQSPNRLLSEVLISW